MKTLDRNASNDIFMSARRLCLVDGVRAQCVLLDSLLNTQQGELQFDEKRGIDYFGTVFQGAQYLEMWAIEVRHKVKRLDFVKEIERFEYRYDRDTQSVIWSMTVKNTDDELIRLGSKKRNMGRTTMNINLEWDNIIGKPDKIEEAIAALVAMKAAASVKETLTDGSSLGDVKNVVNDVVLTPLKSE